MGSKAASSVQRSHSVGGSSSGKAAKAAQAQGITNVPQGSAKQTSLKSKQNQLTPSRIFCCNTNTHKFLVNNSKSGRPSHILIEAD